MISKVITSEKIPGSLIYTDYFQGNDSNVMLILTAFDYNDYLETIYNFVLQSIISKNFENVNINETIVRMKEYFVELNWQLNAKLRNFPVKEKGFSLLFILTKGNKAYLVQFGRFLLGIVEGNNFSEIGRSWDNFHVKTLEDLKLLGYADKNIDVQIHEVELKEDCQLIGLPFKQASELKTKSPSKYTLEDIISKLYQSDTFPYILLTTRTARKRKKTGFLKGNKYKLSAIVIILLLLTSVYYVFWGNNDIEDQMNIQKQIIMERIKDFDLEKLQEAIPLNSGLLFVPARNIELQIEWVIDLPFKLTLLPKFDVKHFYFTTDNKLYVYDKKKDTRMIWNYELPDMILKTEMLDNNQIMAICADKKAYVFKKDTGEIVWETKFARDFSTEREMSYPIQVNLEKDKRLVNGLLVVPRNQTIILINNLNGEELTSFTFDKEILYITDYDIIEKTLYVITEDKLRAVSYDIENSILDIK